MGKSDLRILIGADASNFNKNIKAAQAQLVNFGNVAKSVGSSIKTALVGAFAIDSAQRFFSTMIDAGRGFEDQMARVKAISNANTKQFQMMRKEAARLGETTKYSARQAAAALENLTRNGLSAEKATKALSSVLELAGANAIELAEAADIVTNTMNMFSLSVEELGRVNDVLSKTTASSATNLTDLYEALKYAAPTANLFGINIEEVNAALGVLANQGIKGSQAGTALRNVFNSLVKPSAQAKDILANLGIDEVSIKLDGLLKTLEKFQGLSVSDLTKVFGKEFGGITAALINSGDLTAALKQSLDDSTGEAARMFQQGSGSFNKALDNFSSAFEGAMIKLFDSVKPMLTSFINGMTDFINTLSDGGTLLTAIGTTSAGVFIKGLKQTYDETKKVNTAITEYENLLIKMGQILSDESKWANIQFDEDGFPDPDNLRGIEQHIIELDLKAKELGRTIPSVEKALKELDSVKLKKFFDQLSSVDEVLKSLGKEGINVKNIISTYDENNFIGLEISIAEVKRQLRDQINLLRQTGGSAVEIDRLTKAYNKLNIASKSFNRSTGNISNMLAYQEVLKALQVDIANVEKKTSALGNVFTKLGGKIKGVFAALGGWWTVGIAAVSFIATSVYKGIKDLSRAEKEATQYINDAKSANDKLSHSFQNLVNELAKAEKGSIAWESRLAILKRDYPELVDELRLSEVYLNSTSTAFQNLAASMDEVIKRQKELNLAEAANAARGRLNKAYLDSDYGIFSGSTELKKAEKMALKQTKKDMQETVKLYFWEIGQILTSTTSDVEKVAQISKILREQVAKAAFGIDKNDPRAISYGDRNAKAIINDYMKKAGNAINNLPKINGDTFRTNVSDDLSKTVYKALQRLEDHKSKVAHDASVKFTDQAEADEYIATETKTFANQLIDEILNSFKNIKIDGKEVREILKMDANFDEILKAARITIPDRDNGGSGGTGDLTPEQLRDQEILEAEDKYAETMQMLADLCEKDLITTEDFNSRHLSALQSLINVYEKWWKILDEDQSKMHIEWVKYLKELQASPADNDALTQYNQQVASDRGNFQAALAEILGRKSGIDPFSDNMTFQGGRLDHLKGQLEDLKALREEYLGKGFDEEVKQLDGAIVTLAKHVEDLDKAFTADRLKEFKKELSDLTWGVGLASYDTFMGLGQAFINVGDALKTFNNLDQYEDGWERFVAGFQAFVSIVDTMVNTAVGIKDLAEMFRELTKQKELYNAIDSGSRVADIAGIEGEAAAVVAAEATKSAAIQTAAVSNIAAKVAQAKAAQVLMAAESTAAYAAIPFAGVALAAAQIAEMEALIAAAAALPAFANGGIVGGSSFSGDKVLARVNSGEMILNQKQQKNLFSMLNNGSVNGGGQVKFKIEGKELVGVLKNYNNIKGKVQ